MAKVYNLSIRNFRSIKELDQYFKSDFICLIGRGDSGKSTILEAISCALSSNWAYSFFDNDFFDCNTSNPISIEVSLRDLPDDLIREDKFGLYLRGIDASGKIVDEIEDAVEPVITIKLEVKKDLEPQWNVITNREIGNKPISATDRAKLNAFLVSDYVDRHFSWSKGSPLYSLLKQEGAIDDEDNVMIDALREAKTKIDGAFTKFDAVINKVKASAANFGVDITKTNTTIDFKDIVIKDGKVSLHDETIPFRLKGKGSKRLISMAIQASIADAGGIVLIDEIEQGLESDRVQSLVNTLKKNNHGQVFITTHSRDVLVELTTADIFLVRNNAKELTTFDASLQGLLRKNPEAFFAKKVLVAEGATEIGVCRALNNYRITKGEKNVAFLGVRIADGSGSEMMKYCKGFQQSGFPVMLFCDSDNKAVNTEKQSLISLGISIVDWEEDDCFETAVMKYLPFSLLQEVFELAATIKNEEDNSITIEQYKTNMWDSVKAHFGVGCPGDIKGASDSQELRLALGKASVSSKKEWFKRQDKACRLATIIFNHFDKIDEANYLKKQLKALSSWIDK